MARKKTGMISLEQGDIGYEIVDLGTGESRLIQTDWDFPGVAASFGWRACKCGRTDGTVDCPHKTASQMIGEAAEFLDEHIGDEIEDPGYFAGDDMAERRARSVSAGMDPFPNPGAAWHRRVATDRREWMEYAQDELADARARGDKQAIRRYEKMLAEYEGRTAEQEHSLMTSGDATEEEAYTQGIRPLVLGNPPNLPIVDLLARKFLAILKDDIGENRYQQAAELNLTYPKGVCASHDFCDANMVMNDAWDWVVGTPMNPGDEEDARLWSKAWDLVKNIMVREHLARKANYPWVREHGADYDVPNEIQRLVREGEATDASWHNDIAPHFEIPGRNGYIVGIWVQHPDPDQRESGSYEKRFGVEVTNPSGSMKDDGFMFETDDARKAVAFAQRASEKAWEF